MKAPHFWFQRPGICAALLAPLGAFYAGLGKLRRAMVLPVTNPTPLIVVGNVVAGGAGKTPVTIALAHYLQRNGLRVHLIAKGYGGRLSAPTRVDPTQHSAADVGDEPLLLAQVAPTWIAKDRGAGWLAASVGADVVISDDGFQNPRLRPTLSLLVMDDGLGLGNGRLIPAGPLREPLSDALARATAIVRMNGATTSYLKPTLDARFMLQGTDWLQGASVFAFAGIAHPDKFFESLTAQGATLTGTKAFPDHHPLSDADLKDLLNHAKQTKAQLVTTLKDFVRLPPSFRGLVRVVEGGVVWQDEAALESLLKAHLPRYKAS